MERAAPEKVVRDRWHAQVRCDECQFGVTWVDDARNVGLAQKATGFMTNDEYIAEAVDRREGL